jgi:hypothetical protein
MREVVRCIHCKLNQFVTVSGLCRKCHKVPVFVAEPEPAPEVIAVEPAVIENKNFPITRSQALGLTLLACRIGREYSQGDLAELMGTHRTWLTRVEHAKVTPTIESLLGLARGLNLSPRFILEMAEAMASA